MQAFPLAASAGRSREDGLTRMLAASFAVHAVAALILFTIPRDWLTQEEPRKVSMSLALGSPGQKTGGMTPAGARPVQEVAPPPKRPTPIPPAAPPQAAPIAVPAKPPKATPRPDEPPASAAAPVRPPTTGPQKTVGSAAAETGGVAQAVGLSGSGQSGMAGLATNFCCPEYGEELRRRLWEQWQRVQNQPDAGQTIVSFVIRRDGSFADVQIVQSSGSTMLDIASRALFRDLKLPPLPEKFKEETLTVKLRLDFKR